MLQLYTYTYACVYRINDTIIKTSEDFFRKICTSHFICKVACERELETEQRLQHIDLPSPSGHRRVSFSFSRTAQPGNWGPRLSGTCSHSSIFSLTGLVSKLNRGSRGPLLSGGGFLYHNLSNPSDLQLTDFLSSPSYITVQSPTQSLEWHVWSSSSGNNCHAVHRSLSSGASVYECTMGFFPCPIISAKPAYAISSHNCYRNVSLPSGASLWNGMFDRVEGQYTTGCYGNKNTTFM